MIRSLHRTWGLVSKTSRHNLCRISKRIHFLLVMVYLAKVDNAATTGVTGLKCTSRIFFFLECSISNTSLGFKIAEDGLDSSGLWGVNRLLTNKGKATAVIPSCIPSGNYLLR